MTAFRQSQKSQWGSWAEDQVTQWARGEGWYITQTCKIEQGGAPKAIGEISALVLPDIQRAKNGVTRWGEIKFKDSPAFFRARNQDRHGVELPNWNDYLAVERETGIPGDLFILEWRRDAGAEPSPVLLALSFREARNVPVQEIPPNVQRWAPRGMIYWARDSFELICRFDSWQGPSLSTVKDQLRDWRQREAEKAEEAGFILTPPRRHW